MKTKIALAIALGSLAIACGKPYQVVRLATPNPFVKPGCKLAVEDLHYDRLMIGDKTPPQYLSEKKEETQDKFQADLADTSARFVGRFRTDNPAIAVPPGTAGDNTFTLRAFMTQWEPGFYAYVASQSAQMNIVVDVVDSGGNVLDEIIVHGAQGSGFEGSGTRMRSLGERLGHYVTAYIRDRWVCAPQ